MTGPRLSIIPARFVEDTRPDLSHYKVLNALGRHLDSDGWCRVKQTTLADAIGLSRETVCRKLNNLVEWGYVEKDDEDGSGRAIEYRVLLDTPSRPSNRIKKAPPTAGPVSGGSQVDNSPTCDAALTPGVTHTITPGVMTQITPGVTPAITHNDPSERSFSTPTPPTPLAEGQALGGVGVEKIGTSSAHTVETRCIAELMAAGRHVATIEALIVPILAARRLTGASAPAIALGDIAKRWHGLPKPVLEAAVERCLAERADTVRCGDIDAAARFAKQQWEARKAADQRETKAAPAEVVRLEPGTPAHAAYLRDDPLDVFGKPRSPTMPIQLKPEHAARYLAEAST